MGVTSRSVHGDGPADGTAQPNVPPSDARGSGTEDSATRELIRATAVSDRCTNCGAPLASDQRYCVNCGERRGKPRFPLTSATAPKTVETATTVRDVPPQQRLSSGLTLVLGVGALLLALLIGVLIGHNNSSTPRSAAAAPVQVVTVGGGSGSGASTAPTDTTAGSTPAVTKAKGSHKAVATKKVVITKQVAAKASQAAASALGGSSQNLAPPTVTQGGSCQNGQAGCQGNKFTGNFFGQ